MQPPKDDRLPFLSVVVSFHNERNTIRSCVQSLLAQTYPVDSYEIILVNNGSTNDTASQILDLAQKNSQIRLLDQADLGIAAGRNLGVRHARGEIVLFTDPDCIPNSQWLEEHEKCYAGGDVDGVDGRIETDWSALHYPRVVAPVGFRFLTSNLSFTSEALRKLHGFDERFRAKEDSDLEFRASKMGLKIVHNERAVVYHPPKHLGVKQLIRWGLKHQFDVLLWKKHGDIGYFRILRLGPVAVTHETLYGWLTLLGIAAVAYIAAQAWLMGVVVAFCLAAVGFLTFRVVRPDASLLWTVLFLFSRMVGRLSGCVKFRSVLL